MTFDLQQILESKLALRRSLASCTVAEKLALLDALRDRTIAIRQASTCLDAATFARGIIEQNRTLFEELAQL